MTMTRGELNLLHSYLNKSTTYLEFGAGESTVYAAGVQSLVHIDSVDSNPEFVENNLLIQPVVQKAVTGGKLRFHLKDLGRIGEWGHPLNDEKKHLWPEYSTAVFKEKRRYDLVLIDGRFRVACALQTLLHTPPGCIILIHDFWNREQYHILLRYLEVVERMDTMAAFERKAQVNFGKLNSDLKRFTFLPDDKTLAYRLTKRVPQILLAKVKALFRLG